MRKELYKDLCTVLKTVGGGAIKHVDLWNHNVEFIEQEENWERPAVFVEFCPEEWKPVERGKEYYADPLVKLHVVTDWKGSAADGSEFMDDALDVFDLCKEIHKAVCLMNGDTYGRMDLVESDTNHNHEDILENIEVYKCKAVRILSDSV